MAFAISAALLLTACKVGPNYHAPQSDAPAGWVSPTSQPAENPSRVSNAPADLVGWWRQFNDPTLTSLVERSINSNLDVKLATARLRQARAARGIAEGGLWPDVQGDADVQRSAGPVQTASGVHAGPAHNSFQAGLDAAWEIDIFGGIRRNIEAAEADIAAAAEDRNDVLVSLTAEVALDYIDLRTFQARVKIARKNLAAQRHSLDLTKQRQVGGFASSLDVANAEAQASATEAQIPTLEQSVQQRIYDIALLLGKQPGELVSELSEAKAIPIVPPEIPVGLPAELMRRRPDIRRAEVQVHAATARIGVATADLFPRLSLAGTVGFQSSQLAQLGNWSSRFWSAGPAVTWDIFNAGRVQSNIEVQKALTEQSVLTYQQAVLTAFRDSESALEAYSREQMRTRPLESSIKSSSRALDLSTRLYTEGLSDFLNVLTAQRALFLAQDAEAQNRGTLAVNLVSLYKALGGGWEMSK